MKKLHKLAAAVAVAAGIALSPQTQAIELKTGGVGDAMLFPVFAGMYENYFTISNSANEWVQGHLRFRGAAWSAELLDFDIILSPGDVFVFRLADVDGDGEWEIDGNLDKKNFQYTGMVFSCSGPSGTFNYCVNASNMLMPDAAYLKTNGISDADNVINLQKQWGYVEFIGEAVLKTMTQDIMKVLLSDTPGTWAPYVTSNGNKRGTNTWRWSDAEGGAFRTCPSERCDRGLSDVPNALSGTAFVTVPGQGSGIAYNAEVFRNFRTADYPHRINNYGKTVVQLTAGHPNTSVILHHEDASFSANAPSPAGDYVYGESSENRDDEVVISFNNTWGPTLADGDDYLPTSLPDGGVPSLTPGLPFPINAVPNSLVFPLFGDDTWDARRAGYRCSGAPCPDYQSPFNNSITEVEMAIREMLLDQRVVLNDPLGLQFRGQSFTSFYFDDDSFDKSPQGGKSTLSSFFLGHFPTKFYYAEGDLGVVGARQANYLNKAVLALLKMGKPIDILVWNIDETPCTCTNAAISPARTASCNQVLGHELNIWDIKWLKKSFTDGNCGSYRNGRTEVHLKTSLADPGEQYTNDSYPGLLYTFEMSSETGKTLTNWRSMSKY